MSRLEIISLLGPPGAGKGTVSQQCRERGYAVLSTGNLFREHMAQGTDIGNQAKEIIESGKLVPDSIVAAMVEEWLQKQVARNVSVIFDGYPRTQNQIADLVEMRNRVAPELPIKVIEFSVADQVVIDRICSRVVCSNKSCQAVYSRKQHGDITECVLCGGEIIRRSDDDRKVISERLLIYHSNKSSLVAGYHAADIEIIPFDVTDVSMAEMFPGFLKLTKFNQPELS